MAAAKKSAKASAAAGVEEATPAPVVDVPEATPAAVEPAEEKAEVEVEDMEHLQLTLQEAFFLSWSLDCLSILDPSTSLYLSLPSLWLLSLQSSSSLPTPILHSLALSSGEKTWKRLDNPFLVNYAVYHHFRSLGWVVKSGIKFCVDLLLYKRGPVFAHAECVSISLFLALSLSWGSEFKGADVMFLSEGSPLSYARCTKTQRTKRPPHSTYRTRNRSPGRGSVP